MKVGFGATVWARGVQTKHLDGIGVYTRALWQAMEARSDVQPVPYVLAPNPSTMPCGMPAVLTEHFPALALRSALLGAPRQLSAKLRREVDVFHATDHHIPRLSGVPVVATVMDLIPLIHPEWVSTHRRRLKNWLFGRSIGWADQIITISDFSKRDIVQHLGVPAERVHVTPLGVESEYFIRHDDATRAAALAEHGLSPGFFMFVGTLQPRKNLAAALAAHGKLPAELRKRHPLVVIGRNGWGVEDMVDTLRARQDAGEARWLEYLPRQNVIALMQSAAAMVFVSRYEGFGLPVIEAFAAQCPVICSNTTSLPAVAGDAALQVDPMDDDAISLAMREVLEDHAGVARRIELGIARARSYTWQACAEQTLRVYRRAAKV
ncbi:glycosyltransferase family 4 protein [Pigmentiphaga aceris]|uniref:Glycosyltransferase family 4 protein n=1 Tax=Pigmentiphaga aceris TaxID=1940612 RepID=A0A5C0B9A0_9BURK|nr:glycosyltransferase family 4 protein [Pigmentiphaga aceris]